MSRHIKTFGLMVVLGLAAPANAAEWQLHPPQGGRGVALTYGPGAQVAYRFECAASDVIVTETGVTNLMDIKTGNRVGNDADAVMLPGAALMSVYSGEGKPQLRPAEAVKNPGRGWDLTIRVPKNDEQLNAIGKSKMMTLFTTGYTMAVAMDKQARATWNDFLRRCKAAG